VFRPTSLPFLVPCALCACTTLEVQPFRDASDTAPRVGNEGLLWDQSRELDLSLTSAGVFYEDETLRAYVQGVVERLFPEFVGAMQVRVLESPVANAFTTPPGLVYVHAGLLSLLANEAQLATVLAHEGTHFTHRHGIQNRAKAENAFTLANVLSATGLGLFAGPIAASSVTGYSRDLEREADRQGFARLVAAGYEPGEAVEAFRRLLARSQAMDEESPLFFASHPKLEERIASFEELSASAAPSGVDGAEAYREQTATIHRFALEADLQLRNFAGVLAVLELDEGRLAPEFAAYYRGEALRQRAGEGDGTAARAAFEEALQRAPDLACAHRSLGRLCLKLDDPGGARTHLSRYLELAPDAPDRGYVTNELEGIPR
jgi:predicted Zn-dependent protease